MTETDLNMSIDECIANRSPECTGQSIEMSYSYLSWLCPTGSNPICNYKTKEQKLQALEYTKNIVLNNYFAVGILEDFSETLKLFEKIMPQIFTGVTNLYENDVSVKKIVTDTKTLSRGQISEVNRAYLEKNVFAYEVDLYNFVHVKFLKQLEKLVHVLN